MSSDTNNLWIMVNEFLNSREFICSAIHNSSGKNLKLSPFMLPVARKRIKHLQSYCFATLSKFNERPLLPLSSLLPQQSHQVWLTLTELGRRFGISAVHCGHHLSQAGLRDEDGLPFPEAIDQGYAYKRPEQNANRSVLWNYDRCSVFLRERGLHSVEEQRLVEQWADFLEALHVGSAAILVTPQEMADSDMPHQILPWVNQCLAARGSQLRISRKNPQISRDSTMESVEEDRIGVRMSPLAAA